MDIQKTIKKIDELTQLANRTDSKKEDFEYRQKIRALARQLEEEVDKKLDAFPATVKIHIKVDKVIEYDTFDFKSWLRSYMDDTDQYDVDLDKEFEDYFHENFYPEDYIDSYDEYDCKVEK